MHFSDSFRAARWIRFINLLLQAVLFLALFGGLNYIALNHAWRFDLSQGRRHSLSAETKSYLERLERDVKIYVTLTDDSDNPELAQSYRDLSGLLREYTYLTRASAKGKIDVRFVNVYQNRREAEELNLEEPNVVVLVCGDHRRVMKLSEFYRVNLKEGRKESFLGESALTAGILDVSNPDKKKIYFLAGHGEMRPDDVDPLRGLSVLSDELRSRNYAVDRLDLSITHKIPDDAALILIIGQQGPVQPFEQEMLRNYLQTRAGRIILMLDPGRQHGLEDLLFDWGIIVYANVIVDLDPQSLTENRDLRLWRFARDPLSHITDSIIDNTLPVVVGPARVVTKDIGSSKDDGLSIRELVATSENAWGVPLSRQRTRLEYIPGTDLRMKNGLGVMVVSERLKPNNDLPLSVRGGRLAVLGTADLVTNNRIITVGNLNLFLATVGWAVEKDTQLNIPPRPIQRFQLALSQEELVRLRLGLFLIVPGVVALLGILVYWTRRH